MLLQFGPKTRIVLGSDAVRPTESAARYLQTQIENRVGWHWEIAKGVAVKPGDIALGIPGDGMTGPPLRPEQPEEVVLWCGGNAASPSVFALAGGPSVAIAAAGRLARAMGLRPGQASLPGLSLREHAAFPVRGHLYANHKQNNTYDKWSYAHWEEYLTEMAAWGDNIALFLPLHPTRWAGSLPFDEEPWFDSAEREEEFERQLEIQLRLPGLCHDLGMRYGIWLPVNDVFPEEVKRHPEITKYGGACVCVQNPEARGRVHAFREGLFSMLPSLDVLFLPSRDDGGCPGCEECTPWAPVYVDLVKEQSAQVHQYHPECKLWLSQQGFGASETEYLLNWLDRDRPTWVEAVAYGPQSEVMTFKDPNAPGSDLSLEGYGRSDPVSGPVNRLRAALPGQYQLILYPDETHTFRCQYPVVSMDPMVQFIWKREDGPSPRAKEMAELHAATCAASDGTVPYSEGNTDDVNKFVWSARSWDPTLSGEQVAYEYARWFFGPECAQQATEIILKFEDVLNGPIYGSPVVHEVRELVEGCEASKPTLLDEWRWLNLRLGALMLDHIQQVVQRDRRMAAQLRYRIGVWRAWPDPVPGLRQTIQYLEREFEQTEELLHEIVWTRDRLFAMQRLAVRGVARLQNSYMKLDVLLGSYKDLLARLERGEQIPFPEQYQAILDPLRQAEDSLRLAVMGIPLVEHIQEFTWEKGATTWSWS